MTARLRARLHGLRRGHQVHERELFTIPLEYGAPPIHLGQCYACHGCDRTWTT